MLAKLIHKTAMACLATGVLCIGVFLAASIDARVTSHAAENAFEEYRRLHIEQGPDQSLWSPSQREHYEPSLDAAPISPAKPPSMNERS